MDKKDKSFGKYLKFAIEMIEALFLGAMVIIVFINVIGRFFFNYSLAFTEDLGKALFVWSVFLGAVLLFFDSGHVRVDLLPSVLKGTPRKFVEIASNLLVSVCLVFIIYSGAKFVSVNMGVVSPLTRIPEAVLSGIIPVSAAMMLIYNIMQFFRIIKEKGDA